MHGGGEKGEQGSVNPVFKKLYTMLKDVPLVKIPTIPQFEQKNQDGGYKKGSKLKTQENGTRKFVLFGFSYEKDINKDTDASTEIKYELENTDEFGQFDNIKPREAAKKIYSRLCKNLRKDYGEQAANCVNMLLHIQEKCCDNLRITDNKVRDYYYYIKNTPNKRVITRKNGKTMTVFNNAKAIPIFAIRNRRNEHIRTQSVNEAIAVAEKKRSTSLDVYARRKNSGKKLLKNARI